MKNILTKLTETEATAITDTHLENFLTHLKSAGRAPATISQYSRTVRSLQSWLSGRPLPPALLMEWKTHLTGIFAPSSTNAALAAVNSFLICMKREPGRAPGWDAFEKLSYLKVQRRTFCEKDRVLEEKEYEHLIRTAREQGDEKTALLLETICALGIRVSELAYITVEALKQKKSGGLTERKNPHHPDFQQSGVKAPRLCPEKPHHLRRGLCYAHREPRFARLGVAEDEKTGGSVPRGGRKSIPPQPPASVRADAL